jgi:hypothetical protein
MHSIDPCAQQGDHAKKDRKLDLSPFPARVEGCAGPKAVGFMLKRTGPILILLCVFAGSGDPATPRRQISDEQIVARAELVASGSHVEVYQHEVSVDRSFVKIMESAYEGVERVSGLKLDSAVLGPMVRVYVSDAISVSHVWKGYQHPRDPKGAIFLNLRAYHGAMGGRNATHAHELTHLFTWRYHSHTLREGIADYVALKLMPGAAVGPNAKPDDVARRRIAPEILEHLGTTKPAPEWVSTDPARRADYYFASYRLVKFLVERKDLETFWKLYASEHPENEIKNLYGLERNEAIQAALAAQ